MNKYRITSCPSAETFYAIQHIETKMYVLTLVPLRIAAACIGAFEEFMPDYDGKLPSSLYKAYPAEILQLHDEIRDGFYSIRIKRPNGKEYNIPMWNLRVFHEILEQEKEEERETTTVADMGDKEVRRY